jgi:hypothetical protein
MGLSPLIKGESLVTLEASVVHERSRARQRLLVVYALRLFSPSLHLGVLIVLNHTVRSELIHLISDVLVEHVLLHHHISVR